MIAPADFGTFDFDPLDATKVWTDVPEVKVGKMTLNKVPANFFQFTEQVAFSPGMVVPGIEPSEDRLLQGRLFSYADTQRYRIGANYLDLPVNRPAVAVSNGNQGGAMNGNITNSDVNYGPSVTTGGRRDDRSLESSKLPLAGTTESQPIRKQLNFKQAGELYRSFIATEKTNLIANLAGDLKQVRNAEVKAKMVSHFFRADPEYGTRLAEEVGVDLAEVRRAAEAPEPSAAR